MTRKFSEVLGEYLEERERQNGDYYTDRFFGDRLQGRHNLEDLAQELDKMIEGVEE